MTAPQPWPTTRLCPATSNLPTRMLASSWQALCAAMQRREVVGANRQNGMTPEDFAAISAARFPCAVCAGRALPPGMELITQEEVSEMARTTKRGVCELCGAHANIGVNHGSKVCPSCTHIQSALNKRVEVVAKAARAMHKTEDLLGYLIPDGGGIAVKMTADFLQEISGIVDYDGEDPGELVEAVRRRVLTCASCDSEDVIAEIREIVEYSAELGDSGLADAVRRAAGNKVARSCADCTTLRGDLLRACGLETDDTEDGEGWDVAVAAAIQEIAIQDDSLRILAKAFQVEVSDSVAKTRDMAKLEDDFERALQEIETVSAKLTLAQQARDEWESRAVQAESNVETLEAELRNREDAPAVPCASTTYLLDIALKALRGEGPDADQLATLIDAARRAA